MKKYLLLIIALLFLDSFPGMFVNQSPFNEWQARIKENPNLEKQIDQLLRDEVAKYHPGFTNWTWQGVDNKARGQWSANLATRTIKIPYPDLIFLSDYIMGKITKQAIISRLAILHHEITHIIKQHANVYHPSRIALANALAYAENASEEHKQNLFQKATTEMQKTEWEADYGIPNIPNLMQTFSGVLRSQPSPHPLTPLSVTSHPHSLARASIADDRYAKLKVGHQINRGLTFAQDIKPKIEGTSPLKAAKVLGVEDPYYYPSLAQEDHPFEITLIGSNDTKISLPYHVAMYANAFYNYMQDNPSKETEYPINIQDFIDQNIVFTQEDLNLLNELLTYIEQAFSQGMLTQEAIPALAFGFLKPKGISIIAKAASLADLFKIPLIDEAIVMYYKQYTDSLEQDKPMFQKMSQQPRPTVLKQGAQRILTLM